MMTNSVCVSYSRNIIWHPNQKYTNAQYFDALDSVFELLFFENAKKRYDLLNSYKINLRHIVLYAIENNIDELEHINSIRNILLKSKGCCDLRFKYITR